MIILSFGTCVLGTIPHKPQNIKVTLTEMEVLDRITTGKGCYFAHYPTT